MDALIIVLHTDINLCSHIWAVCYLAQSVFDDMDAMAEPCSRKCPTSISINDIRRSREGRFRKGFAIGYSVPMGHKTPASTSGSYCVRDQKPPFCPETSKSFGDMRCCIDAPEWATLL